MEYKIRPLREDEIPLLRTFLYEAVYQKDEGHTLPPEIVDTPEIKVYIEGFGEKEDDRCLVAECGGRVIGAVWTRILSGPIKGYGNVDDKTPEFAVSLYKDYRGRGIGTQLMEQMLFLLRGCGYARVSLSVQKENYAVGMYRKVGFSVIAENEKDYIMTCVLNIL